MAGELIEEVGQGYWICPFCRRENPPDRGVYDCRFCDFISAASALGTQVGGDHYKQFAIQPIEFTQANKVPPCEASVIKYVMRHRFKNGREDLEKAKHYIDLLLELEYGDS